MRRALAHSISAATSATATDDAAPRAAHERPEQPRLAVEHPRRLAIALGRVAPELGERDRVERARGDAAVDAEPADARDELARGLAGERDREHVARLDAALAGAGTRCGGSAPASCRNRRAR